MNIFGIVISLVYVFIILGIGELLRKKFNRPQEFTRKFVHVTAGNWVFFCLWPFTNPWYAIVPPIIFIFLNILSYYKETFKAIEVEKSQKAERGLGTVYFPITLTVLVGVFWGLLGVEYLPLAAAAIMWMTWGDGLATPIGQAFGKHKIKILELEKTVEGSIGLSVAGAISSFIAMYIFTSYYSVHVSFISQVVVCILGALIGAIVELFSIKGTDNLTVPLIPALILLPLWKMLVS